MKCRYCGEQLEKGIEVCKACGRVNESIFRFGKLNRRRIIAAAVAAVAVIVAIGAVLVFTSGKHDVNTTYNESKKESKEIEIEPWRYFTDKHDIIRTSYENIEDKYGVLGMHENDMSTWGDFTYLGLNADAGIYYYTDEDMLFTFEGTGLYCMGIAGTAEQLFGITESVDMKTIENMLMLDEGLAFEWATDIRDRNWYGIKEVDYNTLRISFYNDDVQGVTPRHGYDPLTEGSKYPSRVTLDNIDTVFYGLGTNYRTLTPTTHVSICIEKW